jgi:flagellar motor switch protein FliM
MSEEPMSSPASAIVFDEIDTAAPGIGFSPGPDAAPGIGFSATSEDVPQISVSPEPDAEPFVFGQNGGAPGVGRLSGLERMGEKIARALRPAIEAIARARVAVAAAPIEIRPYQEWQDDQQDFAAYTLYRLRPLKGGMLVQVEAAFVASLVEIFYGGAPATARQRKPGDFTASEDLLLNRVLDKVSTILAQHWNEIVPVDLGIVGRETNLAHLNFVRGDEPVAVQSFALSAGVQPTTISVVYPLATLRPIEEHLETRGQAEDGGNEAWRQRLAHALERVGLPVRSVLARPEISVAQLLALQPGDVIPIALPSRTPLLAGTLAIAEGVIGEQDGRAALRVERIGKA